MFKFKSNIIKRRKIRKSALLTGLISASFLGYVSLSYLELGRVPIIEEFARQIGLTSQINLIYVAIMALLIFLILPAIRTIFKKKVVVGGSVSFDEENLKIIDGKDEYLIPGEKLPEINFELKALPSGKELNSDKLFGGSWMKIPTSKGTQAYELNIDNSKKRTELLQMIEFLKIEHDVKVKVKELK